MNFILTRKWMCVWKIYLDGDMSHNSDVIIIDSIINLLLNFPFGNRGRLDLEMWKVGKQYSSKLFDAYSELRNYGLGQGFTDQKFWTITDHYGFGHRKCKVFRTIEKYQIRSISYSNGIMLGWSSKKYLRVVQTQTILFLKSMSERVGSDMERLWIWVALSSFNFESI